MKGVFLYEGILYEIIMVATVAGGRHTRWSSGGSYGSMSVTEPPQK
jgi:hypothetical protein